MRTQNRKREIRLRFRVTPHERELIEQKMTQVGTTNMAAYLRKVAIDGYVLRLELPELKEMISLLRRCSNNLNQIAKHANETGRTYSEDLEDVMQQLDGLWENSKAILTALAKMD